MRFLDSAARLILLKHNSPRCCVLWKSKSLHLRCYPLETLQSTPVYNSTLSRGVSSNQQKPCEKHLRQLVKSDIHYLERRKLKVLQMFPNVKSTLLNLYKNLADNLDPKYSYMSAIEMMGRLQNQAVFHCSITVNWPKDLTFEGYGLKKKTAELAAILKTAEMLYENDYITQGGHPVTASEKEKRRILEGLNQPPSITVPLEDLVQGWKLINRFQQELEPEMNRFSTCLLPLQSYDEELDEEREYLSMEQEGSINYLKQDTDEQCRANLLTGRTLTSTKESRDHRSMKMIRNRWKAKIAATADKVASLPMRLYEGALDEALMKSRVVVIAGDTGCGKSTQVPQMILDKWIQKGVGADCNILVSQPRRIAAISLAKHVAKERGEKMGETIGYHVRLQHHPLNDDGGILFCTTGMLLQKIRNNPMLESVSHVIVDEVHERSVQTDLLLILLRRLLLQRKDLYLILMSASLSTSELRSYFEEIGSSLIEVPGTLYPLTRHYLPDALIELGICSDNYNLQPLTKPRMQPVVNVDLVVNVIQTISQTRPPGAILCFLPGWQDIESIQKCLTEDHWAQVCLWVLPLHSSLSTERQELIFEDPPEGKRKVILSTNIAETSLTVTDVVYVVDTGCHKEQRYSIQKDVNVLGNYWISQANSQQRAGRAGRLQPGEIFHLYSTDVHNEMNPYPVPEIMRIPLEQVILTCKAHCGEESAESFLSDALSVPSQHLISTAVNTLEELGMLTTDPVDSSDRLTPLGCRVVHFSTPPHFSKALVYASIFRCLDPVLTICSILSEGRGIFCNAIEQREDTRKIKMMFSDTSDLLAMLGLVEEWEEMNDYQDKTHFCDEYLLNHRRLLFMKGIKDVYAGYMRDGMLINEYNLQSEQSVWNENSNNMQLILAVILAGVSRVLLLQKGIFSKGFLRKDSTVIRTQNNDLIHTSSDSVFHQHSREEDFSLQYLVSTHVIRDELSRRTIARDLSILQPITAALFAGNSLAMEETHDGYILRIDGKRNLTFQTNPSVGELLVGLRCTLDQCVNHVLQTRGMLDEKSFPHLNLFCEELFQYVSHLVFHSDVTKKRNSSQRNSYYKRSLFYDDEDDV